jgi:predicted metal-dependent hydrolase|tara:strand:+ start:18748 stop:19320 length:573 start_codon:yes stop_codon:yes gene_type:complete
MNNVEVIIIFIVSVYVLFTIQKKYYEAIYVKSTVDDTNYVVKNVEDAVEAANILARLNINIQKLLEHVKTKYPNDENIHRLLSNYNQDNISEGTETSNYTSYSVNKGEKLVFCLRSRDGTNTFVDENVLMYVATHELSHLMTKEIGHPDSFWENFKSLLQDAIDVGVYKKVDFSKNPVNYCGIDIKSSVI